MATALPSKHKSSKQFFWAITSQTEILLSGYLRHQLRTRTSPQTITLLIAKFCCNLFIDSKILQFNEIDSFLSLFSNQWNNERLSFKLLHRGSDHQFQTDLLRTQVLDVYNEYVVLVNTNHGHTFGIYNKLIYEQPGLVFRHIGFEFVIKSNHEYLPKLFPPQKPHQVNFYGLCTRAYDAEYLFIPAKNCYVALNLADVTKQDSLCIGYIGFTANRLCGGIDSTFFMNHNAYKFKVTEYEIFQVLAPSPYAPPTRKYTFFD